MCGQPNEHTHTITERYKSLEDVLTFKADPLTQKL